MESSYGALLGALTFALAGTRALALCRQSLRRSTCAREVLRVRLLAASAVVATSAYGTLVGADTWLIAYACVNAAATVLAAFSPSTPEIR